MPPAPTRFTLDGGLVGEPPHGSERGPLRPGHLQRPGRRTDRLRGICPRARRGGGHPPSSHHRGDGVTGVGFAAARLAATYLVRPNLASPVRKLLPLSAGSGPAVGFSGANGGSVLLGPPHVNVANGWVYSTALVDKAGHALTSQYVAHVCPALGRAAHALAASGGQPGSGPSGAQIQACIAKLSSSVYTAITYQPADRFWPLQLAEMGIFLAAALALCGLAYWWLGRRYA